MKQLGMNDEQFAQMVTQYERLVYTICYQFTRNHHTAEDLAQDAFLSAYAHLDSCPSENPKAWFARIATNKAKDHLKSAYNRRVAAVDDDSMPKDKGTLFGKEELPEDITIAKEQAHSIASDILALKEPYHQVAVLFFLEERSVNEISVILGRPSKTVHTQLYRAKHMLQDKLKEKGGAHHDPVS
ncbi:sigma-70 family RNA polymerase sigma factor [Ruminococcaceae bacterium OttesenSCG-928-I18]|nr:sigma-70 family RNA polymerase sigma factor [Ruminococcaceae bacterium OttesenSCG-928-I18]